jgi:twitching motility two-component system response regulator PilH
MNGRRLGGFIIFQPHWGQALRHLGRIVMAQVILVIEDDLDQRRLLERILSSAGYRVFSAPDGQAGIDAAAAVRPALIILDVMMPRMNGYQACRALRQNLATAATPILMFTHKQEPADQFWASEVGASAFLNKPVDAAELLAVVSSLAGPA